MRARLANVASRDGGLSKPPFSGKTISLTPGELHRTKHETYLISVFELLKIASNYDIPMPQGQREHKPTDLKTRPPPPTPK